MTHLSLILEIEKRGIDLVFAERSQRHGGHKLLSAIGNDAGHIAACFADQAHQLAGFISRDAAANNQKNTRSAHPSSSVLVHCLRIQGAADRQLQTHSFIKR